MPTPIVTEEAEALFQAALAEHRAGRVEAALAGYERALEVSPEHFASRLNLGVTQHTLGRLEAALASVDQAIGLSPQDPLGPLNRGNVLRALRRPTEAAAAFERAIALGAEPKVHALRGAALYEAGQVEAALTAYEAAIAAHPDLPEAHGARGVALRRLGRPEEALASYDRAIALQSGNADHHRNRGNLLRDLGRPAEALASYDRGVGLRPDSAAFHSDRGNALHELGRMDEALACFDRAIALDPGLAVAHNARGALLFAQGRFEEALASTRQALRLDPRLALAHRNEGVTLRRLNRPEEAVLAYDRAIALEPDSADAHWYRSLCHLIAGRFAEGWRDYEWRWGAASFLEDASGGVTPPIRARLARPERPEELDGRDVLLVAEQGIGDVVMFASVLPEVMARAARVSLFCDGRLRSLFRSSFPGLSTPNRGEAEGRLEEFDPVLAIGSLGRLFRNDVGDFPGQPFLAPDEALVRAWGERLGPAKGLRRVGISWRGGGARTGVSDRSLSLDQLLPVLDIPDCEFVSLQYGDVQEEVAAFNAGRSRPVRLFPAEAIDDFEALAALALNLDLVVSVQTALVHLCGAVGVPALVMVPSNPEWRYGLIGAGMPWYDSVELFRQGPEKDWAPVVRRVAAAAAERLG